MISSTIIYLGIAVVCLIIFSAYKVYMRMLDEIRDLRDELFEIRGEYTQIIKMKDDQYHALAEMRDSTKLEDFTSSIERDIAARNYLVDQETKHLFETFNKEMQIVFDDFKIIMTQYKKSSNKIETVRKQAKTEVY